MRRLFILILLSFIPFVLHAGVKITGKVKTVDGKIPKLAHVHLTTIEGSYRDALQMVQVDMKGVFELEVDEPGIYKLYLSAADHLTMGMPIKIEENDTPIHVNVTLMPYLYVDALEEVKIIGDWNKFNFGEADVMSKQADGTFVYEAEAKSDTLAYQLIGLVEGGRSTNGTASDDFEWDGGGDYRSILRVQPGKVKIVFDPEKLPAIDKDAAPKVSFDENHKHFENIIDIVVMAYKTQNELFAAFRAHRDAEKDPKDFEYDASEAISMLKSLTAHESEFVRQIATIRLFEANRWPGSAKDTTNRITIDQVVDSVPPTSKLWGYRLGLVGAIPNLVFSDEKKKEAVLHDFIKNNPIKDVRAQVLSGMVFQANSKKETDKFEKLYKELVDNYGDSPRVQFIIKFFDPKRKIMVGKKVPAFEVALMSSGELVSNESLLGKFYLMDFWAVWCGPCVAEMPNLHTAYEKYKRPNLIFLSLSFDGKPEDVEKFRAKKFEMPWQHTFVQGGFQSDLAKNFEVLGIPKPIFIGPDGVILATQGKLRGENLAKTLKKFLERSGTND